MSLLGSDRLRVIRTHIRHYSAYARRHIPAGLRSLAGLALVALGLVGFLPIVGFWMIPLGLVLIWFDVSQVLGLQSRFKPLSDRDDQPKQSRNPSERK